MLKEIIKIKEGILDIILPKKCLGCGREGQYICKDCEIFLSESQNYSKDLFTVWEYEGLMKKLISMIKQQGKYHIIDELVMKAFEKVELNLPKDLYIAYVPMSKVKEKQRGFNQSKLMAKKIGEITDKKVIHLLRKTRDICPQSDLNFELRKENPRCAFDFQGSFIPENVLLVDDFYATGATAKECRRVLKENGVGEVWIFALACQSVI